MLELPYRNRQDVHAQAAFTIKIGLPFSSARSAGYRSDAEDEGQGLFRYGARFAYAPRATGGQGGHTVRQLRTWCTAMLLTILVVGISAMRLDEPIAYFIHDVFGRYLVVGRFTGTPSFFSPLAMLVFLVFLARRFAFRPFGKHDIVLVLV